MQSISSGQSGVDVAVDGSESDDVHFGWLQSHKYGHGIIWRCINRKRDKPSELGQIITERNGLK